MSIQGKSVLFSLFVEYFVVIDKFQHYDMGVVKNMKKYGQPKPPEYDLRKVTSPVVLYYSQNDRVVDKGVRR